MIISKTPFRISFVGGGTDFPGYFKRNGGMVISTAINKHIYVTINGKFDRKIHVRYSSTECVDRPDDLKHKIVREALKMAKIECGVEIVIISDIPTQGSGLGSSSSLSVGLLNALFAYKGIRLTQKEIANMACCLEIERISSPIGCQDQYASAYGGFNKICFNNNMFSVDPVSRFASLEKIHWLEESTMLFYMNGRAANSILNTHQKNIELMPDILDFQKALVPSFFNWLSEKEQENDVAGTLISKSWEYKKLMTPEASCDYIDEIISRLLEIGACGVKLCGAGGGGFMMVVCDPKKQNHIRDFLTDFIELKFSFEKRGTEIIYED